MTLADRFRLVWTPFLKKVKGRQMQAIGMVCPVIRGSGGEWKLRVDGRVYKAGALDLIRYPGLGAWGTDPPIYLWLIPRPAKPVRVQAVWKTALGATYRDAMKLRPADPRDVHVTFKTHIDLGYTDTFEGVLESYRTKLMARLLDQLDATADRKPGKRFVWTLSTWLLEQCLDRSKVKPEYIKRLEKHIRGGQVVWGLMPFTTHTEFFGLEEMCRSIYAARRLAERYGVPVPTAAKMTDVPAHTMALGMAFASAGGRFFQIGTNPDSRPPDVPPLFWWDLPDDQKLLVHYHTTYGTELLPPEDWPWRHWLSLQMTGDNVGPQNLDLLKHMDWIEDHFDWPRCRTGAMEAFADGIIRDHGKELPVVDDELVDWWIHGIASQAGPTALARRTKDRLPAAETLAVMSGWLRGKGVPDEMRVRIRQAFEDLALYTEHTWGDHANDGRKALPKGNRYTSKVFACSRPKPPVDRWAASWERKAQFAARAAETAAKIEADAVCGMASAVSAGRGDSRIMLLNPVAWSRGGVVRMPDTGLPSGEFDLIDPITDGAVVYERRKGEIEFYAPAVPGCGYLMLDVRSVAQRTRAGRYAEWDESHLTLHADEYTLQFHTGGGMARWHDRARSSQWCSTEADFPMGAYLYEMPGGDRLRKFAESVHTQNWEDVVGFFHRHDYRDMSQFGPVSGGKATIKTEVTPVFARVVVEANCPTRRVPGRKSGDIRRYRTTFTHFRNHREIYVNMQLIGKRATYAAEAGYAYFSFSCENPWIAVDRIAHLLDPAEELAAHANAAHMAVHRGVRVENAYAGLNFYSLDAPLLGLGGKPGAYHFDDDGAYESAEIYATLFNNCWGTNFAQWQSGDFSYDFVIQPTGDDDWDGGLSKAGAEVFRPLVASVVKGGKEAPSGALLSIDSKYTQLVALKPADFEDGTVLRLWNGDCDDGTARLRFSESVAGSELIRCDLIERTGGKPIKLSPRGEATVRLKPHETATFLLRQRN